MLGMSLLTEGSFGIRDMARINESIAAITWLPDWLDLWLGMASNYQVRSLAGAGCGSAFLESPAAAERRLGAAIAVLEQDSPLNTSSTGHCPGLSACLPFMQVCEPSALLAPSPPTPS